MAVLIPGTQTPQDCVTDLKALPVQVLADGRCGGGWRIHGVKWKTDVLSGDDERLF